LRTMQANALACASDQNRCGRSGHDVLGAQKPETVAAQWQNYTSVRDLTAKPEISGAVSR
ncbi:MAG: hypothetical protein ACTMI6_08320, partial [Pseudomonas bubulae]